jgi:uncharacterized protein (TIGR02588 family)
MKLSQHEADQNKNNQDQSKEDNNKDDSLESKALPQSPAEWVSFSVASAVLLGVLGTVSYLGVRDRNQQPPLLEVTSSVEQRQDKYYVPFTVVNSGGETAEAVQIIAELRVNGELSEWGDQQIDFLSSQEEIKGAFVFTQDPQAGELTVRVASYIEP